MEDKALVYLPGSTQSPAEYPSLAKDKIVIISIMYISVKFREVSLNNNKCKQYETVRERKRKDVGPWSRCRPGSIESQKTGTHKPP